MGGPGSGRRPGGGRIKARTRAWVIRSAHFRIASKGAIAKMQKERNRSAGIIRRTRAAIRAQRGGTRMV